MYNTKDSKALIGLMGILAMTGSLTSLRGIIDDEEIFFPAPVKKIIPKGCKEYYFYGYTVIAMNEQSARKKCAKKAGIKL